MRILHHQQIKTQGCNHSCIFAGAGGYDPFAISGDPNQLMTGPQPTQPPSSVTPLGDIEEWYRGLVTTNSGVFYEDSNLQVSTVA